MKSSALVAVCGAMLAAAGPILQERRLIVETEVVVEWVTVTVTAGDGVTAAFVRPAQRTKSSAQRITTTTSVPAPPPPPPAPSTSATREAAVVQPVPVPAPVAEPVTTVAPAPKPVTTVAPAPKPVTTVAPAPKPVTPVVEPAPAKEEVVQAQPSTTAPAPAADTKVEAAQPSDYKSTAIFHHNKHRFNHSSGAVDWDQGLADSASVLASRCVFEHDVGIGGGGYGQNLAMWGSTSGAEEFGASNSLARAVTDGWYNDELESFPTSEYGKASPDMSNFKAWGHFTQVVWKDTQRVGCATILCPAGTLAKTMESWYTVCNYSPAGNMGGAFAKNVLPPLGQAVLEGPKSE